MNEFVAAMRQTLQSLRTQNVADATRLIQGALTRKLVGASGETTPAASASKPDLKPKPNLVEQRHEKPGVATDRSHAEVTGAGVRGFKPELGQRARKPLGDVLRALRRDRPTFEPFAFQPGAGLRGLKSSTPPTIPQGAKFLSRSFSCSAGFREYKLYIPSSANSDPHGLVIMLHGCRQDPDDFALGTRMNLAAEANGLIVAYPAQTLSANSSSCWNWFKPSDQSRGAGEPSIIAGITRALASEFCIARRRTFIAGLSAGGAMAAVMGQTYPDLYAAVGIHSGLAYRSATDVVTAFAAMRGDLGPSSGAMAAEIGAEARVRTIVFHGAADRTVVPSNADQIVADARRQFPGSEGRCFAGAVDGRHFSRSIVAGADGIPAVEYWLINGASHAWSGGDPQGSFADPRGPDATAEMVRFFFGRPKPN